MLRVYQEKKGSLVDVAESDGPDRSSSPQSATARVPHELCLGPAGEILVPAPGAVGPQRLATLRRDEFCERRCYGHHGYALTGGRVVLTGDPVLPKGERTFSRNFNTGVVQAPAVGTIGSAARTNIRGPGMNNLDLSLQKNHTQFSGLDIAARFDARGAQVNAQFGEFTGVEKRFGCDYLLATNQEYWPQMNADNADKALRIPNRWYDTISWFWLSPFRAVLPAEFGEIRKIPLWSVSHD